MPLILWIKPSVSEGNLTWVFVSLVNASVDTSCFVDRSKIIPLCRVSEWNTPSEINIEEAKPDGDTGFFQRKLPTNNAVVVAGDTDTSMPSVSNLLFNSI